MNIFLFISIAFLFTYVAGKWLEKIHVPWIFAALIFGVGLSLYSPLQGITGSETFDFLAQLGMYFLLFIVGFEINIKQLKKQGPFIARIMSATLLAAIVLGTFIVKYYFDVSWMVAVLISLSFATVGEAILVPILDQLKIVNTRLGRAIIGIGTMDDVVEIIALVLVTFVIGSHIGNHIFLIFGSLILLSALVFGFTWLSSEGHKFHFSNVQTLFFIVITVFFLFVGIGDFADAAPLAALLAGVSIRTFISNERLRLIENEIRALTYGLFAPLFFIWIGASIDMQSVFTDWFLVILVVVISSLAKILASIFFRKKDLNFKESLLLGIGLSVRFSTGIVIVKIFLDSGLITDRLYSVIIASSVIFTLFVPFVFSRLLFRWRDSINV